MNSSLFTAVKLRALDEATRRLRRPSRIDPRAEISGLAEVIASELHGAVTVAAYARLFKVSAFGPVAIGASTSLWGPRIYLDARPEPITIGNFCSVARDVSFHGFGHDTRRISTHYIGRNVLGRPIEEEVVSNGPIEVGHDVWIGAGAQIMSGTSVGTGAVIGAGAVVTHDVPPYTIAVGVPARPVRARFPDDLAARLLELSWWEWSPDQIRARYELFTEPVTHELLDRLL